MTTKELRTARSERRAARRERDKAARAVAALLLAGHEVDSTEVQCVLTHFLTFAKTVEVHADIVDAIVSEGGAL